MTSQYDEVLTLLVHKNNVKKRKYSFLSRKY